MLRKLLLPLLMDGSLLGMTHQESHSLHYKDYPQDLMSSFETAETIFNNACREAEKSHTSFATRLLIESSPKRSRRNASPDITNEFHEASQAHFLVYSTEFTVKLEINRALLVASIYMNIYNDSLNFKRFRKRMDQYFCVVPAISTNESTSALDH